MRLKNDLIWQKYFLGLFKEQLKYLRCVIMQFTKLGKLIHFIGPSSYIDSKLGNYLRGKDDFFSFFVKLF